MLVVLQSLFGSRRVDDVRRRATRKDFVCVTCVQCGASRPFTRRLPPSNPTPAVPPVALPHNFVCALYILFSSRIFSHSLFLAIAFLMRFVLKTAVCFRFFFKKKDEDPLMG